MEKSKTNSHNKCAVLLQPLIAEGVIGDRVAVVVGKYLDAHPEHWNDPAVISVLAALRAEWSWPSKK